MPTGADVPQQEAAEPSPWAPPVESVPYLSYDWAPTSSDGRIARRSRLASIGLVLILLGPGAYAVWSSQVTFGAAREAGRTSVLSEDYAAAARAAAKEESLERIYRLEPGPLVRARVRRRCRGSAHCVGVGDDAGRGDRPGQGSEDLGDAREPRCGDRSPCSLRSTGVTPGPR